MQRRQFAAEGLEFLAHLGQFCQSGKLQFLFSFGRRGDAEHRDAVGHVVSNTGHCAEPRAVADVYVIAEAGLATDDDVVAGRRAAGDAHLGADNVVLTDAAVVGDLHEVIDLRAVADRRSPVSAPVDRAACADFHVAADSHVAKLCGEDVPTVDERVTEAVGPDYNAAVKNRAVADDCILVEHDAGADGYVLTDRAARHQVCAGQDGCSVADVAIVVDGCTGMNVDAMAPSRGGTDDGTWMNAYRSAGARRTKMHDDRRECCMHVGDENSRQASWGISCGVPMLCKLFRRNNRGRLSRGKLLQPLGLIHKRDLAARHFAEHVGCLNRSCRIAFDASTYQFRQLFQSC